MKIVHLADLHLGFRQYQRLTAAGLNQREADVAFAFRQTIDSIIDLKPDLVLIAGDVFHTVRPTNTAILQAYVQFDRLVQALPDAIIVMIAGNHDTPRTADTVCILRLFRELGITVVESEPKSLRFAEKDLHIFAAPHGIQPPRFDPDPASKYNVLLLHEEIEGVINRFGSLAERSIPEVSIKELGAHRWDYVALGHYHVYHQVAPNAWYSGAIEYSSTNVWGEIDEERRKRVPGKGFIEHNLATGEHRFHQISLARRVVDMPEIEGEGLSPSQLSEAIVAAVEECEGGIDERIVRLIVRDVPRHVLRDLDHRKIREFKRRALNFLLDARRPIPPRVETGSGAPGRRASLTETVRSMLESRTVTPGIDQKALVDLGLRYLDEAERLAPALTGDEG